MSDDEKDAAILRLVKDRSEAKRRKLLLESELRAAGESLAEIGQSLRHLNGGPYDDVGRIIPQVDKAPNICGLERIRTMLTELSKLQETLAKMNESATELGIA